MVLTSSYTGKLRKGGSVRKSQTSLGHFTWKAKLRMRIPSDPGFIPPYSVYLEKCMHGEMCQAYFSMLFLMV